MRMEWPLVHAAMTLRNKYVRESLEKIVIANKQ
jgi:hypothetical protein